MYQFADICTSQGTELRCDNTLFSKNNIVLKNTEAEIR